MSRDTCFFHQGNTGSMDRGLTHDKVLDIVFRDHNILPDIGLTCPRNNKLREVRTCTDPFIFYTGIYPPGPVNNAGGDKFCKQIN